MIIFYTYVNTSLQISIDPNKTQYALIYSQFKAIPLSYQLNAGQTSLIQAKLFDQSGNLLTCSQIDLNNTLNKEFSFQINSTQVKYLPTPTIGNITCENNALHLYITLYSNNVDIQLVLNILGPSQTGITQITSSTKQIQFDVLPSSISVLLSGPLKQDYKINIANPLAIDFLLLDQYGNVKDSLCCSQCFQFNVSEDHTTMQPLYSKMKNDQVCSIYYQVKQDVFKQKVNVSFLFNNQLLQALANNQPWFYEIFSDSYILSWRIQIDVQNGNQNQLLCDLIIGILLIISSIVLFFVIFEKKRKKLMEEEKKQKEKIKQMMIQTNVNENSHINAMNTVDSSQMTTVLQLPNVMLNKQSGEKTLDETDTFISPNLNAYK